MTASNPSSNRSVSFGDEQAPVSRFRAWFGTFQGGAIDSDLSSAKEHQENPTTELPATDTARSVTLGLEESRIGLSDYMSLEEMLKIDGVDLVQHLLETNTFFHGKVGFFEKIISRIYSVKTAKSKNAGPGKDTTSTIQKKYIYTYRQLPEKHVGEQLVLLPRERSNADLNVLVSKALLHDSKVPVWLIANPLAVHRHLLLGFRNFFIASDSEAEIRHLRDILSLPKRTEDYLLATTQRKAVFLTDYEDAISRSDELLAIVHLSDV